MNTIRQLSSVIIGVSLVIANGLGSSNAHGAEAGPAMQVLGITLDQDGPAEVNALMQERGASVARYNNGSTLQVDGNALGIDRLLRAQFYGSERIFAACLTFKKAQLKPVAAALKKKYRVVKENIPFVGNAFARYASGEYLIQLEAPHLSFEFTVCYAGKAVWDSMDQEKQQQAAREQHALEDGL